MQQACGNVGPICSRIAIKKCQGVTTIMYKYLQKRTYKIELFVRFTPGQNSITATIRVAVILRI